MFHTDNDEGLKPAWFVVCSKHGEAAKGSECFYDQICLSAGPVRWPASPAVINRPYFPTKQMKWDETLLCTG